MMITMDTEILIHIWQQLLTDPRKSWVLFEHGTCVVLPAPDDDLAEQATKILKEFGPVHAGAPAGDFAVIDLRDAEGWAVTGHHRDILTYVGPDEPGEQSELAVGLCGRSKRDQDGAELRIIHVEDKRIPADLA